MGLSSQASRLGSGRVGSRQTGLEGGVARAHVVRRWSSEAVGGGAIEVSRERVGGEGSGWGGGRCPAEMAGRRITDQGRETR